MAGFEVTTRIASPPAVVFDLARDVGAHAASMAGSGERAVGGVTAGLLELGDVVTWRARHFGVTLELTARVVEMTRPERFVDEQVDGPFARWWHEHRFEEIDAGTEMIDRVEYDAPFGPLGRVAERLVLDRYLAQLIRDRAEYLQAAAEKPSSD